MLFVDEVSLKQQPVLIWFLRFNIKRPEKALIELYHGNNASD